MGTNFPAVSNLGFALRTLGLQHMAAAGTESKIVLNGLLTFGTGGEVLLRNPGPGFGTNDQVNDQPDQIANQYQQCPQQAIHFPPFRIPVHPGNHQNPDRQQDQGKLLTMDNRSLTVCFMVRDIFENMPKGAK